MLHLFFIPGALKVAEHVKPNVLPEKADDLNKNEKH